MRVHHHIVPKNSFMGAFISQMHAQPNANPLNFLFLVKIGQDKSLLLIFP